MNSRKPVRSMGDDGKWIITGQKLGDNILSEVNPVA
jgi:hypothetical protein